MLLPSYANKTILVEIIINGITTKFFLPMGWTIEEAVKHAHRSAFQSNLQDINEWVIFIGRQRFPTNALLGNRYVRRMLAPNKNKIIANSRVGPLSKASECAKNYTSTELKRIVKFINEFIPLVEQDEDQMKYDIDVADMFDFNNN